jgi:hypothetical protein
VTSAVNLREGQHARWHTHPLGQTLIVRSCLGWAQRCGGAKEEIRPGDVVWFPPGEKHWHGAAATTAMAHIAIQEALNGKVVDWMEHVRPAIPDLNAHLIKKRRWWEHKIERAGPPTRLTYAGPRSRMQP